MRQALFFVNEVFTNVITTDKLTLTYAATYAVKKIGKESH